MAKKETPSIFCSMETFRRGIEEKLTFEGLLIKTSLSLSLSLINGENANACQSKTQKKLFLLISTDRKKITNIKRAKKCITDNYSAQSKIEKQWNLS